MNSVFSFILVLGVLIFVHEFGHFITAKLFGIKVLKFSLGFGPKIIAKQFGETEYRIGCFPLGGYVKMLGEQSGEELTDDDKSRSFSEKPVIQRFLVVLAGPLFNLLTAVLIFFFIIAYMGMPHPIPGTTIGTVSPDSPAQKAGFTTGDIIKAIDDTPTVEWEDVSESIRSSNGRELRITVERNGESIVLIGTPDKSEVKNIFGEAVETRYLMGITKNDDVTYEKATLPEAFMVGLEQTWFYIYLTVMSLVKIVQRVVPASEIGGPILIAQMAGQQLEAGWLNLLSFMAVLSVNLGVINLFPIPILDGGHLVFFSVEALRRKPMSMRSQEILQQIGLVLLVSLMFFVFYNDFARILSQ
nr:RIP metalloprotease RseP [Desulfobulbaceae bacterium]